MSCSHLLKPTCIPNGNYIPAHMKMNWRALYDIFPMVSWKLWQKKRCEVTSMMLKYMYFDFGPLTWTYNHVFLEIHETHYFNILDGKLYRIGLDVIIGIFWRLYILVEICMTKWFWPLINSWKCLWSTYVVRNQRCKSKRRTIYEILWSSSWRWGRSSNFVN
jgi:hypothetical protein